MTGLTIGKLAAAGGVGVETVRFYQRRGLLAQPERRGSGYREYCEADRARLLFIRRARRLGFTLVEISDLLGPAKASSPAEIARAAQAKLAAIDQQVRELELTRCRLRRLLHVCEHGNGRDCAALQLGDSADAGPAECGDRDPAAVPAGGSGTGTMAASATLTESRQR
jgi:DNA-binding transcriptional MerR regulator